VIEFEPSGADRDRRNLMPPTRTAALLVAAALAVATLGLAGPSAAADRGPSTKSSITAHPSDDTPRVGQQFAVRGVYDGPGARAHDVKIQTFRNNRWLDIDGARVATRSDGSYRVRLILDIRGVRGLRAVGIAGGDRKNSYARFVVEVFR
jgi:hypothetical protein